MTTKVPDDLMPTPASDPAALFAGVESLRFPEIGRSTRGRPLYARVYGDEAAPALVVMAGIHGNEPASVAAVLDVLPWLAASPTAARAVWVVPALNPDGLLAGEKNSARDVDLNRNFPARNFGGPHKPGYFPGHAPLCEPETAAFARLLEAVPVIGVVAVHAPFACVNFDGPARRWAEDVAAACGWPAQEDIGYPTPGSLGSWLGVDRGLPVLTIELPAGHHESFRHQAHAALQTAINSHNLG